MSEELIEDCYNLEVDGSIPILVNYNLLINYFLAILIIMFDTTQKKLKIPFIWFLMAKASEIPIARFLLIDQKKLI